MLDSLITSKTRVKLLLKFFSNPGTTAYLRGLAEEFGESTNAVRLELNRLASAGLLDTHNSGRTKVYSANPNNPLFPEINGLVRKYLGIDFVEGIVRRLGNVELAFISGDYALGIDSGVIDLVVVGDIKKSFLNELAEAAEKTIKRKIRTLALAPAEYDKMKGSIFSGSELVIWKEDKNKKKMERKNK